MKIQVISPEIGDKREDLSHDFWVRKATNEAIVELGHEALPPDSREIPDIQLVFAGMDFRLLRKRVKLVGRFKAVWLYSKPDEIKIHKGNLNGFHQIYTLTTKHAEVFKKETGLVTKPLRVATNKVYSSSKEEYLFDVAYMGTKIDYRVQTMKVLAQEGYKVVVAGHGWTRRRLLHKNIYAAKQFWPNDRFVEFYNQAPLSVYPTRTEFTERGIVPIRVVDIYASSDCLCLCPVNPGLKESFTNPPPQYESVDSLLRMVKFYLDHPAKRNEVQRAVREGLVKRTYKDLVLEVVVDAMNYWSKG